MNYNLQSRSVVKYLRLETLCSRLLSDDFTQGRTNHAWSVMKNPMIYKTLFTTIIGLPFHSPNEIGSRHGVEYKISTKHFLVYVHQTIVNHLPCITCTDTDTLNAREECVKYDDSTSLLEIWTTSTSFHNWRTWKLDQNEAFVFIVQEDLQGQLLDSITMHDASH